MAKFKYHNSTYNGDGYRQKGASIFFSVNFMCAQTPEIWKTLIFSSEIASAKTGAMHQLVRNRGLQEPHLSHYSLQYGDKGGKKNTESSNNYN